MSDVPAPIAEIPEVSCWGYLATQEVGRFVTAVNDVPEIFPVNFVLDGESVVFRTAEGSKLWNLLTNDNIAFEVDGWTEESGWSIVLHGRAEVINDLAELARCKAMPLRPWIPTHKTIWVRLITERITGRRFLFGPEPA